MLASSGQGSSDEQAWIQACTDLPFAWGAPRWQGRLKVEPEDFEVEEELGFTPDGKGEHVFLLVQKRGLTTPDAQLELSRQLRVHPRDIAYSGMKDKQALTRQWFSVQVPKGEPPLDAFHSERMQILQSVRNSRKLRRGSHAANRFRIRLTDCAGDADWLQERLAVVARNGVPNYFGPQRFGNGCSTLLQARDWLEGRVQERKRNRCSLLLSAARAFLFNQLLATRVRQGSWNRVMDGEVLALAGTGSVFPATRAAADELERRLDDMDIHPSGALWGRGESMSRGACAELEQASILPWAALAQSLEAQGLQQERRALRLQVAGLRHHGAASELHLEFTLARGCYATCVLRELIDTGQP